MLSLVAGWPNIWLTTLLQQIVLHEVIENQWDDNLRVGEDVDDI